MKSFLQASLAASLLLGLVAGCNQRKAPQSVADLQARLDAALAITASGDRDSALSSVAADAADLGFGDIVKNAVASIVSSSPRDAAAQDAAVRLAKVGQRAVAREVAQMIYSSSTRDDTLKKLAQDKQ